MSQSGTLRVGSGYNYADGANCEWMIAPTQAGVVTIIFTEFNTQDEFDTVTVIGCNGMDCSSAHLIAVLSGTYTTPQVVSTSTGFMKLAFTSDSSINGAGFFASWSTVCMFLVLLCV